MVFPRINRDKKEWAFGVFNNAESSATLAKGSTAVWSVSTPDGNKVVQAAATTLSLFVGIVLEAIVAGDYGRIQTYGFCSNALVFQSQTTVITAGDILLPVASQQYLSANAVGDGKSGFVYAAESLTTVTTGAASLKKVFIRAL